MNTGMVFGMIFAAIVIGLLLIFGAEQIINIFCLSSNAQVNKAVKDLENEVENVFVLAEGSAMPFTVAVPRNAMICFINHSNPAAMNNWRPEPDKFNIISNKIRQYRYNLWIYYGCGTNDDGYKIRYLQVSENFCVGAGTELYLENKGYHVTAEKPAGT